MRGGGAFEHPPAKFAVLHHYLLTQISVGPLLRLSAHLPPCGSGRAKLGAEGRVEGCDADSFEGGLEGDAGCTNAGVAEPRGRGGIHHFGTNHLQEGGGQDLLELVIDRIQHSLRCSSWRDGNGEIVES